MRNSECGSRDNRWRPSWPALIQVGANVSCDLRCLKRPWKTRARVSQGSFSISDMAIVGNLFPQAFGTMTEYMSRVKARKRKCTHSQGQSPFQSHRALRNVPFLGAHDSRWSGSGGLRSGK